MNKKREENKMTISERILKVLKDAGEYGVRGANGAIVIKTGK